MVASDFRVDSDKIKPESSINSLLVNDDQLWEVTNYLEESFNIELADNQISKLDTIQEIQSYIERVADETR